MKHLIPDEIISTAELIPLIRKPRTPGERLELWAKALERHAGPLNALTRLEDLPSNELRAYRGDSTPLTVAFNDPSLRAEGLRGDSLGDAMDFFELNPRNTHWLLCDCYYHGAMTGTGLAKLVRYYARSSERRARWTGIFGRMLGWTS